MAAASVTSRTGSPEGLPVFTVIEFIRAAIELQSREAFAYPTGDRRKFCFSCFRRVLYDTVPSASGWHYDEHPSTPSSSDRGSMSASPIPQSSVYVYHHSASADEDDDNDFEQNDCYHFEMVQPPPPPPSSSPPQTNPTERNSAHVDVTLPPHPVVIPAIHSASISPRPVTIASPHPIAITSSRPVAVSSSHPIAIFSPHSITTSPRPGAVSSTRLTTASPPHPSAVTSPHDAASPSSSSTSLPPYTASTFPMYPTSTYPMLPSTSSLFHPTRNEHVAWIAGENALCSKWYIVVVGRRVGVFDNSADASSATAGVSRNISYGLATRELAVAAFERHLSDGTSCAYRTFLTVLAGMRI
ncbi:hypothetical protein C8Q70DRAFT_1057205 [Cubamyces menziesii]|nr:hypothetical protein C8Q70DRAFT_1057205 [Cubamyces menziesii]